MFVTERFEAPQAAKDVGITRFAYWVDLLPQPWTTVNIEYLGHWGTPLSDFHPGWVEGILKEVHVVGWEEGFHYFLPPPETVAVMTALCHPDGGVARLQAAGKALRPEFITIAGGHALSQAQRLRRGLPPCEVIDTDGDGEA